MKAIVLPRAGGKTTRMLRWLVSDARRVLVVTSMRERERLVRLLQPDTSSARRVATISEFLDGRTRGRWIDPVYGVDELEHVLAQIVLGPVEVVTFTGEVER